MSEQQASIDASSDASADSRTWWSRAILVGSVVAVVLLPLGALGARFGIWSFQVGFLLLAGAMVLAAIGFVVGIAGLIAAARRNLKADRSAVLLGTAICVLILAVMGLQFYTASTVPPIHDITTDVNDPPAFDKVVALRGEGSNPLDYDPAKLADLQQTAYPWVKPLATQLSPGDALNRAIMVLEHMGLEVVNVDRAAGIVEATATTFWFGFKDDVVVRVRPQGAGALIDVRSVSRVGVSDLGTNARRIGTFIDRFGAA
ncbi:MAG: DUF1499 domain-containing protein [Pseudomonadales bacterium]